MKTVAADESLALLREGYDFLPRRGRDAGRPWFETRLMGRPAVCLSGEDAPERFYTRGRFTRRGALPPTTLRLLQDLGSVNQLDGREHLRRKAAFLALLTPEAAKTVASGFQRRLDRRLSEGAGEIVLLKEAERLLCATALAWVGVPARSEAELRRRSEALSAMVGRAGSFDPGVLLSLARREKVEAWARGLIRRSRAGRLRLAAESPLAQVARWTDASGELLPVRVAAVEIINLLRPIVAAARYVAFAAHALHRDPEWRGRLKGGDETDLEAFAQEVRRFYPFFPAVGGVAQEPFEWKGRRFSRGEWVLVDLDGADRDPARWERADDFDPDRFVSGAADAGRIVAQGAGDPRLDHRCPGERMTVEIIRSAALLLASHDYATPRQDLSINRSRMPTAPASGFRLRSGPRKGVALVQRPSGPLRAGALAVASGLALLSVVFFCAPRLGVRIFGLPRRSPDRPYVQALAFRDAGLAVALAAGAVSTPAALRAAALGGAVIPLLDASLVAARRRRPSLLSLAAHLSSGAALLALAWAADRQDRRTRRPAQTLHERDSHAP